MACTEVSEMGATFGGGRLSVNRTFGSGFLWLRIATGVRLLWRCQWTSTTLLHEVTLSSVTPLNLIRVCRKHEEDEEIVYALLNATCTRHLWARVPKRFCVCDTCAQVHGCLGEGRLQPVFTKYHSLFFVYPSYKRVMRAPRLMFALSPLQN